MMIIIISEYIYIGNNIMSILNNMIMPISYDKPIITFVDDDGQSEFKTVTKPIYDSKGIKVTLGIITSKVGESGYLSKQELLDIQKDGYEIASHTKTHNTEYYMNTKNVSSEIYDADFKNSKQWFVDNGFDEVDTIVYPFANFGEDIPRITNIAKKYYSYGINADGNYNESPNNTIYLNRFFLDKSTISLDFVKRIIDEVYEKKAWMIIGVHSWSKIQIDEDYLSAVIDYIKSKNIDIMTFKEAKVLKGNIVSIGDFTDKNKGFFVGRNGNTINKSESFNIINTNFYGTLDAPLTDYPTNKLILNEVVSTGDTLTNIGGFLFVYNGSMHYGYELFISQNSKDIFQRVWDYSTNEWRDWVNLTAQNYNIIPGVYTGTMDDPITSYPIYKETVLQIDASKDALTHGGGVLKVYRGDPYYCYSIFIPLNENKIYRRLWDVSNNRWTDFQAI